MWARGYAADMWMLFGTVAIGVGAGYALGVWCAARAHSRRARVVERAAVLLYCTPAYVLGLGVLLLFHPTFGTLPLPYFFDATPIRASPLVGAVGLVPLAARALARRGGAARGDVHAARRRAAP